MSDCNVDPWQDLNKIKPTELAHGDSASFEDNFTTQEAQLSSITNNNEERRPHEPLPDSANYLQLLERKLAKVQKGTKLLDSLQEKKDDCMRTLLAGNDITKVNNKLFEFDTPLDSGRLQRHLLPVQALTVGETLEIVKHDALEEQQKEIEEE